MPLCAGTVAMVVVAGRKWKNLGNSDEVDPMQIDLTKLIQCRRVVVVVVLVVLVVLVSTSSTRVAVVVVVVVVVK